MCIWYRGEWCGGGFSSEWEALHLLEGGGGAAVVGGSRAATGVGTGDGEDRVVDGSKSEAGRARGASRGGSSGGRA